MKNVSEAMGLRNALLENFERALTCSSETERQELLNVVIVGGGATGVEVAGALSEMKNYVLPKDYPDMPASLDEHLPHRRPDSRSGFCRWRFAGFSVRGKTLRTSARRK